MVGYLQAHEQLTEQKWEPSDNIEDACAVQRDPKRRATAFGDKTVVKRKQRPRGKPCRSQEEEFGPIARLDGSCTKGQDEANRGIHSFCICLHDNPSKGMS